MTIEVRNQANIPNKYLRYAKWKMYKVKQKFKQLEYTEFSITKEGSNFSEYKAVVRLGVAGYDIILTHQSDNLLQLWKESFKDIQRYLRKNKEKRNTKRA